MDMPMGWTGWEEEIPFFVVGDKFEVLIEGRTRHVTIVEDGLTYRTWRFGRKHHLPLNSKPLSRAEVRYCLDLVKSIP